MDSQQYYPPQQYNQQPPQQQQQQQYYPPQQYIQQPPQQYNSPPQPYYPQQQFNQPPPQQQYNQPPSQQYYSPPQQQYNQPPQQQYNQPSQQQYYSPPQQQNIQSPQQQQFFQAQPHQQQYYQAPLQPPSYNVVAITPTMDPNHPRKLAIPPGSDFNYNSEMKFKSGLLELRIISAHNLVAGDLNGKSDGFCKIRAFSIENLTTKVCKETLSPQWNSTFSITIADVGVEMLVIEVIDYDIIGHNDSLGYIGIDLSRLPRGIEVQTKENLIGTKHGTLEIGLKAMNFGLINIPSTYPLEYVKYRQEILVGRTREQIKKHIKDYRAEMKKQKIKPNEGPFFSLLPPPGFKNKGGWLWKEKATSNSKSSNSEHSSSKPRDYSTLNNSGSKKSQSSISSICDAIGAVSDALSIVNSDDS
ncbi:hypothetical protein CYY_008415 [Polysphondylium violaceum]|uniref:C2 domain-containing protein n=1 Tax=Polysphondylium violaceum TaxID=133409 RepID=A0A8J4PN95_9MYCE|nr:hypothetical protein CYY_008415 [Polysphondylium violaceum]